MIRLYKANINEIGKADYMNEYNLLDCYTRDRLDRLNEAQKNQTLCGRILLRRAMYELFGVGEYSLSYNENGKPQLDFCHFNISHSGLVVVLAVSKKPIGVDVERIREIKRRECYKLFSNEESRAVNSSANPSLEFLRLWTRYEAAVKCLGLGIINKQALAGESFNYKTEIFGEYIIIVCEKED